MARGLRSEQKQAKPAAVYFPSLLLVGGPTAYSDFHEWAHVDQHARGTWLWRLRARWREVPVLGRLLTLGVECEAAWLARRGMRGCGVWHREDAREALAGLGSYAKGMFEL